VEIRFARPEEGEALARVQAAAWREGLVGLTHVGEPTVERLATGLRERVEDPDAAVVVAEADGEAAGFTRDGATQRRPDFGNALEARYRQALPG
jgi:hypothetical protein